MGKRLLLKNYSSFARFLMILISFIFISNSSLFSNTSSLIGTWYSEYSILLKDDALYSFTSFTITKDSIHVTYKRRTTDSNDIFFGPVVPGRLLTIMQSGKIKSFQTFSDSKGAILFSINDSLFNGTLAILYEKINDKVIRFFLDGKIIEDESNLVSITNFDSHNFLRMEKDSLFTKQKLLKPISTIQSIKEFQKHQQKLVPILRSKESLKKAELASKDETEVLTNVYIVTEALQEVFLKENKNPYESNHLFFSFLINEIVKDYNKKIAKLLSKSKEKNLEEIEKLQNKIDALQLFLQNRKP